MPKRLVVACDGTWSRADQATAEGKARPTNVTKVARAVARRDKNGNEQLVYYGRGVGALPGERVRGGIFGWGLSREVKRAYRFIAETYEPGDQLYFFGYSRGAFTARSTAGFIRNVGILRPRHLDQIDEAYALYRDRAVHPRDVESELFRRTYSHDESRIRFIGVWDTVGALGIPLSGNALLGRVNRRWSFHDTKLSKTVEAAFQALAIDERRQPFKPAIWEQDPEAVDQWLEQVWSVGVHGDVGGGGLDSSLSDLALWWMVERARSCHLVFREDALTESVLGVPFRPDPRKLVHQSRKGIYSFLRAEDRHIGEQKNGCESVASTAITRLEEDSTYRPPELVKYLDKPQHRVTTVEYTSPPLR